MTTGRINQVAIAISSFVRALLAEERVITRDGGQPRKRGPVDPGPLGRSAAAALSSHRARPKKAPPRPDHREPPQQQRSDGPGNSPRRPSNNNNRTPLRFLARRKKPLAASNHRASPLAGVSAMTDRGSV